MVKLFLDFSGVSGTELDECQVQVTEELYMSLKTDYTHLFKDEYLGKEEGEDITFHLLVSDEALKRVDNNEITLEGQSFLNIVSSFLDGMLEADSLKVGLYPL